MIKINRKFLLGVPLALVSLQIYFGIIFGYFLGKLLSGKRAGKQGTIKSLVLHIGDYRLHLHHWLICLGILIFAVFYNFFPFSSQFSFGLFGGLIFQGISSYPDWHKVLVRKS